MTLALVVGAVMCGFLCGAGAWAVAGRLRARRARVEAAVRSALFRTLDEPGNPARLLDELDSSERRLVDAKATAMLPALRGEDRETLARLLESRGATETARSRCHSHRATRRAAACQLLGDVGSSYAVYDLVPMLDDPRPAVRLAAARALGRLGQPAGVAALMQAVAHDPPLPVDAAADAIRQIPDWPLSTLRPALADPSDAIRALAVELSGRCQAMESVGAVTDLLLADPSLDVRVRAARALGRIGSPRAVPALIDTVDMGPSPLRIEAILALGRLGSSAAVSVLRVTLLTPSLEISEAAAAALAAIVPHGVELLEEIAADDNHPVRATAWRALAARTALSARTSPES